jgi:hypothetical protein
VQRLGINQGGYHGDPIDVEAFLTCFQAEALARGWHLQMLPVEDGRSILTAHRSARPGTANPRRFYLSAGIHGDEPAGPLALLDLLRADQLAPDAEFWICPCLNRLGLAWNQRCNPDGIDLNRDYNHLASPEISAHVQWLSTLPLLDLAILLHEDWESAGFYLYELNPDQAPDIATRVIQAVSRTCPIETATEIDGRPSDGSGILRPPVDPNARPDWPEAFWLLQNRCRRSLTLEAPSDFPLALRVAALCTAVRTGLAGISSGPGVG